MRNLMKPVAIAAVFVSVPAAADEGNWYVGGDIGIVLPRDTELDLTSGTTGTTFNNAADIEFNTGFELDAEVGYDFGAFRGELELGYKHANFEAVDFSPEWINFLQSQIPGVIVSPNDVDLDNGIDIISTMANGFFDIGSNTSFGVYVGGGVGMGWAKAYGESNGSFAWQIIAGARYPVSDSLDVGFRYRYFDMSSLDFAEGTDVQGAIVPINIDGNWRSHSLLANVTLRFD